MPTVDLGDPPSLEGEGYQAYGPWLKEVFFDHICSFCLLQSREVQVEHYEPKAYVPDRENDPTNLLLACPRCNGPGGKWDYHPLHKARRRKRSDNSGFLVLDVRVDDCAYLFEVDRSGSIRPSDTEFADRSAWNISLLKLDLEVCNRWRQRVIDLRDACEKLLEVDPLPARDQEIFDKLLPELAGRALFLRVFGLPISRRLEGHLAQQR